MREPTGDCGNSRGGWEAVLIDAPLFWQQVRLGEDSGLEGYPGRPVLQSHGRN